MLMAGAAPGNVSGSGKRSRTSFPGPYVKVYAGVDSPSCDGCRRDAVPGILRSVFLVIIGK